MVFERVDDLRSLCFKYLYKILYETPGKNYFTVEVSCFVPNTRDISRCEWNPQANLRENLMRIKSTSSETKNAIRNGAKFFR